MVIDDVNTMTINQITQNNVRTTICPLPPLPEQHRIVAQIDHLMALCDTLDQQIDAATGTQTELLNAMMGSL
jgi:type I restriction enzyme, S subunit